MGASLFAGIPYPAGSQQVAVPADMKLLADAVDPRLNLLAINENDRNVRYGDVPPGTMVTSLDGWQWVKMADGTWYINHSYEESTSFAWQDDWSDNGGTLLTRRDGYAYGLSASVIYGGSDAISGGNFPNESVFSLPAGWTPGDQPVPFTALLNGSSTVFGNISRTGNVNFTDAPSGTTINNGDNLQFKIAWNA